MKELCFLSVDLQKDFAGGGKHQRDRPSVPFVLTVLLPWLVQKGIKIREIISDYRQPRPGDTDECCIPGTPGYDSIIPEKAKHLDVLVKCMNSPIWTRSGIGDAHQPPGVPFQDPRFFNWWLAQVVGSPDKVDIVLFGLTLDCCVLCTAQELRWRGYDVYILEEATDTYDGNQRVKELLLVNRPHTFWSRRISWKQVQERAAAGVAAT